METVIFTISEAFDYLKKFISNENRIIYELEPFHKLVSKRQLDRIIKGLEKENN